MKHKRILLVLFALAAAFCMMFGLAACGDDPGEDVITPNDGHEHVYDEASATIVREASCSANGSRELVCTLCGYKKTEILPRLEHVGEVVPGKEATCTETGLSEGKQCTVCGVKYEPQNVLPLLGHKAETFVEKTPATCTKPGEEVGECVRCGEEVSKTIVALGHEYEDNKCIRCGERVPSEGLSLRTNKTGWTVMGIGTCEDTELVIPSTYNGKPVTVIADRAFTGAQADSSMSQRCRNLTSVIIPNSITEIGSSAFDFCISLKSVTIPDSVTTIGSAPFASCTGLESIEVDPDNKVFHSAGNCLIHTADKLLIAACSNSVIPTDGSVTAIGNSVFHSCADMTGEFVLPEGITSIGYGVFYGCSGLTSVTLPASLTEIGSAVFQNCTSLERINFPAGWTQLADNIFAGCTSLTSVVLPEGLETISSRAFSGCTGLANITIPASVTKIDSSAFERCVKLESINATGLVSIEASAFSGCEKLTNITLPDSLTAIKSGAFSGCSSLESINIPKNVTELAEGLFSSCHNLSSVTIAEGVKTLPDSIFSGCTKLTQITLPSTLCTTVDPKDSKSELPGIGVAAFKDCTGLVSINIPGGVKEISDSAFSGCTSLVSITFEEGVEIIGQMTFTNCKALKSVTLPKSVTTLKFGAFSGCTALTSITIPENVTSIAKQVFDSCSALEDVRFAVTTGWTAFTEEADAPIEIESNQLTDPAQAAYYLRTYFLKFLWSRN